MGGPRLLQVRSFLIRAAKVRPIAPYVSDGCSGRLDCTSRRCCWDVGSTRGRMGCLFIWCVSGWTRVFHGECTSENLFCGVRLS